MISPDADVARLATGFVAAVQGGYLLAQTSRDVTPMASAIDMAIDHLSLLAQAEDGASTRPGLDPLAGAGSRDRARK